MDPYLYLVLHSTSTHDMYRQNKIRDEIEDPNRESSARRQNLVGASMEEIGAMSGSCSIGD